MVVTSIVELMSPNIKVTAKLSQKGLVSTSGISATTAVVLVTNNGLILALIA